MRKCLLIFASLCASTPQTRADVSPRVALASPDVSFADFEALMAATGMKSYADHAREYSGATEMQRSELKERVIRAQRTWLNESPADAVREWRRVTELSLEADWNEDERRAIGLSFARAADLTNEEERKLLIQQWLAYDAGERTVPFEEFSAKLMNERSSAEKRLASISVRSRISHLKNWEVVVINGRTVAHDARLLLVPGRYRVSVYSSRSVEQSALLSPEEIETWNPAEVPLAQGDCTKAQWLSATEISPALNYVWVGKNLCEVPLVHVGTFTGKSETLAAVVGMRENAPTASKGAQTLNATEPSRTSSRARWIMAGVAIVAVSLMIYWRMEQSRRSESSRDDAGRLAQPPRQETPPPRKDSPASPGRMDSDDWFR